MDYQIPFMIVAGVLYLLIAFVLWYIFVYSPFDKEFRPRKEFLLTIGALFWPIAIIVALIDGWANYRE